MNNLTLYCNCFHNKEHNYTQFNQKNLMLGASTLTPEYRSELSAKGYLFDDTGTNISHENKWLGDLTGLYWVWKNTNDEFVGTTHYRRFWDEQQIAQAPYDENTIYITRPGVFTCDTYYQYVEAHTEIGLLTLREVAKRGKVDLKPEMIDDLRKVNFLSTCNMFFAHRKLFNRMCEVLFPIVLEHLEGTRYALPFIQPKDETRMVAFVAERLCTLIYMHKDYYLGKNVNIQPISYNYYN